MTEFVPFPKIGRLSREIIITEKIDGTNACIHIGETGEFLTGSRSQWITPSQDNFGFSRWAHEHKDELLALGPGTHFGEWWGSGIQRGYGLSKGEKRFSLFNVRRWNKENLPACVSVVPTLGTFEFETNAIFLTMRFLLQNGSQAAPGFMKPEGVVIFHSQSTTLFKKTFEKDDAGKGRESDKAMP